MKSPSSFRAAGLSAVAAALLSCVPVLAQKASPERLAMQGFMRQKLAMSQSVLEGLTLEKFEQTQKSALILRKMTQTNAWSSSKNVLYMEAMTNYQANIDQLWAAAGEHNLENATAAYARVVRNCVDCHRLVRLDQRVRQVKP